jgi:DNA-binding MarR family transcriptional regulator
MKHIIEKLTIYEHRGFLKKCGVYKIRNKENNKIYIGSTSVRFLTRLSNHVRCLFGNKHHSIHLQNSYNLDRNIDKFEISIIEVCDKTECIVREQIWIDFYQSYNDKYGYNISPSAKSCFGIRRDLESKVRNFEKIRKLTDDQIIEIFRLRNVDKMSNKEISKQMNIKINHVSSILTRPSKYKYVKDKYNLVLDNQKTKFFTMEVVQKIYRLYEVEKFSIRDISEILKLDMINLSHLIKNQNIYKEERDGLIFNFEKGRKNKIYKNKKRVIVNKKTKDIIPESIIKKIFNMRYSSEMSEKEISDSLNISEKNTNLILNHAYQKRKYNNLYLDLKTDYYLREKRFVLTESDIINIFNDYNSGKFLMEDLNKKYGFYDVGLILNQKDRINDFYKSVIEKNCLVADHKKSKNRNLKADNISERNKMRSGNYKVIDPYGNEMIINNLSEFCKDLNLDPGNMSRICKTGNKHKGWKCIKMS